jgi:guanylate kinase
MILILGRSGVGKDTLANRLAKDSYKVVKSYTTRPRRTKFEDTHLFLTKEYADTMLDRVATTTINGYEYFTTCSQIENMMKAEKSVYIIDKAGVDCLVEHYGPKPFVIVELFADDGETRKRAIARADDEAKEAEVFTKRRRSESAEFSAFDAAVDENDCYRGIPVWPLVNNFTEQGMNNIVRLIERVGMH